MRSNGWIETYFPDYKISKIGKRPKMTPTDEFLVRRRILEPRLNMKSSNFTVGEPPLKFIFFQKLFFHREDCSKFHL